MRRKKMKIRLRGDLRERDSCGQMCVWSNACAEMSGEISVIRYVMCDEKWRDVKTWVVCCWMYLLRTYASHVWSSVRPNCSTVRAVSSGAFNVSICCKCVEKRESERNQRTPDWWLKRLGLANNKAELSCKLLALPAVNVSSLANKVELRALDTQTRTLTSYLANNAELRSLPAANERRQRELTLSSHIQPVPNSRSVFAWCPN